jgi:hypothetical protein
MQSVATRFQRSMPLGDAWWRAAMRRLLWRVVGASDGFVRPQAFSRDAELSSEWFKYPPI